MFILFGWGKRTHTDHGPTLPVNCPTCHNQTYWRYKHYRTWFTLFFIPVIPYGSDHYLLCDICQQGIVLNEQQREPARVLAGHTGMYLAQQMSLPDYETKLSEAQLL